MTVQLWSDNTIYNPKIRELRPPSPPKTPPKKPKGKNSNLYTPKRSETEILISEIYKFLTRLSEMRKI